MNVCVAALSPSSKEGGRDMLRVSYPGPFRFGGGESDMVFGVSPCQISVGWLLVYFA